MSIDKNKIYSQAIAKWGINAQLWMVVEECGELMDAIAKYKRGRVNSLSVIEELADVSIMVEQISLYIDRAQFLRIKDAKLQRLSDRLQDKS